MTKLLPISCLCFFAITTANVLAEDAEGVSVIEEIVVTATYRETNLMDTPSGISAIRDSMIEDLGAQSMEDIYTMVPGLSMTGNRAGQNRYTIRGMTSQGGDIGYAPAGAVVGVYMDGTAVTSALGPDDQLSGTLFDIDRVEILKGPQGTLFGEGSQSGTIRYLYKQPDLNGFDFAVNASIADMAESGDLSNRIDAMINNPISDSLAIRATAWRSQTAGYVENLDPFEEDNNTAEAIGARVALRYEGESFTATGSIIHSKQETQGGVGTSKAYEGLFRRLPGLAAESLDELDIFSLALEWDLGWATLQSQTSYTDRELYNVRESTIFNVAVIDFFFAGSTLVDPNTPECLAYASSGLCPGFPGILNPPAPLPPLFVSDGRNLQAISSRTTSWTNRWAQEIRLVSPGDEQLRWTAGAFWKDSEDHTGLIAFASFYPGRDLFCDYFCPLLEAPANTHTDFLKEFAVFGEVSYDISDTLELTAGVRFSSLEQSFTNTGTGTDDDPVSPKLVLSWKPRDDVLVFAKYATGFRPGNVNHNVVLYAQQQEMQRENVVADTTLTDDQRATALATVDQAIESFRSVIDFHGDEVDSFELGLKATLWEGRAALTASAYSLDWQDMIIYELHPLNADAYNDNSGSADIQGFEVEFSAFVTDRFSIRVAGDVNDTEVTEAPSDTSDAAGKELIYSPNNSFSIALDYAMPIRNGWKLDFHLDRAWVSSQFPDSANSVEMPSYEKSNARITARSSDQKWRIALFANNLENDEILRGMRIPGTFYWHSPRQVGLEIGYQMD